MELQGKRIVLGVTGGIAAYKAAELVRLLGKQGADVQVAMTEGATHFVTATTFQALVRQAGIHRPVGCADAERDGAYRPVAPGRPDSGRAGLGRFHRPRGAWLCR